MKLETSPFTCACTAWDEGRLEEAFELFSKAAEAGDSSCQLNLGYFYDYGIHVQRNLRKALHWYRKAYHQSCAEAASNIATIHRDDKAYTRMVWWWRRSVQLGNEDAWINLGHCYESGYGVRKNPEKAIRCYSQALDAENVSEDSKESAKNALRRLKFSPEK